MVPVVIGAELCGAHLIELPETQYMCFAPLSIRMALPPYGACRLMVVEQPGVGI
jgi:hypothetical protein